MLRNQYSEKAQKALEEEKKLLLAQIEKSNKEAKEASLESSSLREKLEANKQEAMTLNASNQTVIAKLNSARKQVAQTQARLAEVEAGLMEQDFSQKVEELFSKQPQFFDALENVYKSVAAQSFDGFTDFGSSIDASAFCEKIRQIERRDAFSKLAVFLRQTAHEYEEHLKALCSAKIEGKQIGSQARAQATKRLENFIFHPDVERLWSVQ